MRTLVVGIDGACLSVLEPLINDGVLPTINALADRSAVDALESQLPPWTPSAWPSMYTGVNPGKHGVYDFLQFDGYDWDIVNRSLVKSHAVWELLSMNGYSSVVLNVPVTSPPRSFDGVLVPGYTAPEEPPCHPESIWAELNDVLEGYRLYNEPADSSSETARKRGYGELTRLRGAAFRYLVEQHDPDFGFVQFQQCDTVFHEFPDQEIVREVYADIDDEIGRILDSCEPEITLLVSDHGIGPMEGYEFRVNDYLCAEGFQTVTAGDGGMPSWKAISRNKLQYGEDGGSVEQSTVEKVVSVAARVGITSQRIARLLETLGLKSVVLETVPLDIIRAGTQQVDFAESTAYMRSRTEMGVRLNVVGREPDGVVSPSEYDDVRSTVIEALRNVTTPDGDPVFERVCGREAVFEGPYLEDAPDIVTVPTQFDHFLVANLKGSQFGEPSEPWEHKQAGVVMATGEGIDPQASLEQPHLFDITPTVLSTFGLPVDERMDGTPLPVIESTGRADYPEFEPDEIVVTDDTAVEERLSNLGYLD